MLIDITHYRQYKYMNKIRILDMMLWTEVWKREVNMNLNRNWNCSVRWEHEDWLRSEMIGIVDSMLMFWLRWHQFSPFRRCWNHISSWRTLFHCNTFYFNSFFMRMKWDSSRRSYEQPSGWLLKTLKFNNEIG